MSKSKIILEKLSKLFEQGIISYKDLSNEIINIIKSQRDEIVLRMKITTKEETEILKKRIEKLENDMNKILPAGGEVKPDEKMGYVSTVEDARKSLENIFKNNIEPNNP